MQRILHYYDKWELFGKKDIMKYDAKCGTCLHKFDCRETTISNAANNFKIFLIEVEICLYKQTFVLCVYLESPIPISCLYFHVMAT